MSTRVVPSIIPLQRVEYDLEDDFEAQLAKMEAEVEAQFEEARAQQSNPTLLPSEPELPQKETSNDLLNIHIHLDEEPTHPFPLDDEPDRRDTSTFIEDSSDGDDSDVDINEQLLSGHSHHSSASAAAGTPKESSRSDCKKGDCNSCVPPEKLKYEAELARQQQELAEQYEREFELYQRDPSLTGFIFNENLMGLRKALLTGRDPNERDYLDQSSALHHAVFHEIDDAIDALLENKANVNIRNFRGETPLMLACKLENGIPLVTKLIEQHGANIHIRDNAGLSCFHHAAEQGRVLTMSLLHSVYGVDINIADKFNKTALHWSAWAGHRYGVSFLLAHGANPYIKDTGGCYPLHWACAKNRVEIINILSYFDTTDGRSLLNLSVGHRRYVKHVREVKQSASYQPNYIQNQHIYTAYMEALAREQLETFGVDIGDFFTPSIPGTAPSDSRALPLQAVSRTTSKKVSMTAGASSSIDYEEDHHDEETYFDHSNDDITYPPNSLPYNEDGIRPLVLAHYPGYVSFYQQLHTLNDEQKTPMEWCEHKNADRKGWARVEVNRTVSTIKRLTYHSRMTQYKLVREFQYQLGRIGYLPVHFFTIYVTVFFTYTFIFMPRYNLLYPGMGAVLLHCMFYLLYVYVMYNWYRIVLVQPEKLNYFTPILPESYKSNSNPTGGDIETGDFGSASSSSSLALHTHDSFQDSCVNYCVLKPCTPQERPLPMKHFLKLETLYTRFYELMRTGRATAENVCFTCEIAKPLRSKHCGACNRCVSKFDHHCPFFNQDISLDNYHNFIWFLILVPIHFIFYSYIYLSLFNAGVLDKILFFPTSAIGETSSIIGDIFGPVFTSLSSFNQLLTVFLHVFVIHLIIYPIFDLALLSQHIHLITNAITTNEYMNRARYDYLSHDGVEYNPFSRSSTFQNWLSALQWYAPDILCFNKREAFRKAHTRSPFEYEWALSIKDHQHAKSNSNTIEAAA